jgi:hypothetical protein
MAGRDLRNARFAEVLPDDAGRLLFVQSSSRPVAGLGVAVTRRR